MQIRPQPASSIRLPGRPQDPGLLLLQVDGLSHEHLQQALDQGLMPNLKARLEEGSLISAPWHCGLPSQTVVVQGGVLYGKSELPGNQWLDKLDGKVVNAVSLEDADQVDQRLGRDDTGLVQGGASYLTPMGGQARESFFAISEYARLKEAKGTGAALKEMAGDLARLSGRLLQHPFQAALTLGRFAHQAFTGFRMRQQEDLPARGLKERLQAPLESAFTDVYLAEAAARHMAHGISQGQPVLYVDFANFDGMSHTFGPGPAAFDSLREVDRNLGTLFQAVDRAERPYQVCVFSDHGSARGIPFTERYGQSLEQFVRSLLPAGEEVKALDFGSAAHVYFPGRAGSLERDQLPAQALDGLRQHEAVAFTVTRQDGSTLVEGRDGRVTVRGDRILVEGRNPLSGFGTDQDLLARQMHDLAFRQDAGDLIVFGARMGDALISFNVTGDRGLHGGIGLNQDEPFVAWSPDLNLKPEAMEQASDLHGQLSPALPRPDGPA